MGYTAAGQRRLEERIRQLEKALQSIANLWPIETTAKINPEWVGENGGKCRAIIAEGAVTIARKALGIEKMP
jgi:hypothetical protein